MGFSALLILGCLSVGAEPQQDGAAPDGWHPYAARDEIAPAFRVERDGKGYSLILAGRGEDAVDGRWVREVPVRAEAYYAFSATYRARNVATPLRSVLARVVWLDAKGHRVDTPEYPVTLSTTRAGDWTTMAGTYRAPEGAVKAELELHLRWAPNGEVAWQNVSLCETTPPSPRKVRLATVNHRPRNSTSVQANLDEFGRLIEEAARQRADIVCLPESIGIVGSKRTFAEVAEPVPGPATKALGQVARKYRIYVVAGLCEREGSALYNTSVLLGRDGSLVGKYRKVCLPREEIDGGLKPGHEYPVFDTDFGRVAMMICWDVHFPEVARALAARGAEVIFMPIWGGNPTLAQARAIENQVYLVASGYDFKTSIFDKAGHAVVEAAADPEVLVTEVDLNERLIWPWLGDWKARIWREGPARDDVEPAR